MSLSRVKTWVAGETLTAADLNAEFDNILGNPTALLDSATPRTYTKALLPNAGTLGKQAYVTDSTRGLWIDQGSQYFATNGEVYNAKEYGCTGDGTTDDATNIGTLLSAAAVTGGTVYFPAGTYAYATSPNFARTGVSIVADRSTIFKHTGSGNAFIIDGGDTGSGILGNHYDYITVQGNANSTNGMYVRSIHHSLFNLCRVKGCAVTGAAFLLEWCVLNQWNTPIVSSNDGTLLPIPLYGMLITRRLSGVDHSSTQSLINPIFEGLTNSGGSGLMIDYAYGTTIVRGTSEQNATGISITANGAGLNYFEGMDCEGNSVADVLLAGSAGGNYNTFAGIYCTGLVHLTVNSNRNTFSGGQIAQMTCDTTASSNSFVGLQFVTSRSDVSVSGNNYFGCYDPGGVHIPTTA